VLIFQFPVVAFILAIATVATAANGTYCEWSSDKGTPKFWIRLIGTIALALSVVAILQFYKILKVDLAHHRPMVKLFAFKAVVGLTFIQGVSSLSLCCTKSFSKLPLTSERDRLSFGS
jgi:hypothetical protein